MMRWLGWITLTLAVAAVTHLASVHYLPHIVMSRAMAQMGSVNAMHHGARATAEKHGVVRPSPDLLYSVCPFDLSKGPMRVVAPPVAGTYWSLSLFDAETNNFFVVNDRQEKDGVDFFIYAKGAMPHLIKYQVSIEPGQPMPKARFLESPTVRGLAVMRTLVNDEKNFAAIDAARKRAKCAVL